MENEDQNARNRHKPEEIVAKLRQAIFLPSRAGAEPGREHLAHLRANWLSNCVFDTYDATIDAACEAWRKLAAQPEPITSLGMRKWAHVGQAL